MELFLMTANNRVTVRVWGDHVCTPPELKVERVSYLIMTSSAARGVREVILWEPQMCYIIDRIAVVKHGRGLRFWRNERIFA
jgi:CRISPR-associated protein Cas5d